MAASAERHTDFTATAAMAVMAVADMAAASFIHATHCLF
jgi:hypothetical protein